MTTYTAVLDNSKTNVEGHYKAQNRVFTGGVALGFNPNALKVVQRGAGANMSVDVSVGDAHLELPSTAYSFWSWIDAAVNVPITTANPTNPRIDRIVGWVDTAVTTTASNNSPGSFKFSAIAGTPAGSPVAVNDAAVQAALGASVAWVPLGSVLVGAAASSLVNANITDTRVAISGRTQAAPLDLSVTTAKIASGAVTAGKIDFTSTGANAGVWWPEIGRLEATGTVGSYYIDVPKRKNIHINAVVKKDATSNYIEFRLSNTGGTIYPYQRVSSNYDGTNSTTFRDVSPISSGGEGVSPPSNGYVAFNIMMSVAPDSATTYLADFFAGTSVAQVRRDVITYTSVSDSTIRINFAPTTGNLAAARIVVLGHD